MKQERDQFGRFVAKNKHKSPQRARRRAKQRKEGDAKPKEWEANFDDYIMGMDVANNVDKGIMQQIEDRGNVYEPLGLSPEDMERLFREFGQMPVDELARRMPHGMLHADPDEEGEQLGSEHFEHIEI